MSSANLDNLVATGQLKKETANDQEFTGLLRSGQARLTDATAVTRKLSNILVKIFI